MWEPLNDDDDDDDEYGDDNYNGDDDPHYENKIGDVGAQELLKPLISLASLVHLHLDLQHNNLGDTGA